MENRELYVPFMSTLFAKYRDEYLNIFAGLENFRPVICLERTFEDKRMERNLLELKDNLEILRKSGYEPMVWIQAFGFGIPLNDRESVAASRFTRIEAFDGTVLGDAMCPLDENFREYYKRQISGIIKAGARRIMLDDDYCLSVRPGLGCSCKKHMKLLSERMGREVTKEELSKELFKGEKSQLRSEWLRLMGESLINFAKAVRNEADRYDKKIEIGFCAGYTSWDLEGVDALALTKALAGENKPFLRLTGAPYWFEQNRFPGQEIPQIIEFARMQAQWLKDKDVEYFTENDSYPRPRCRIPASIMETFGFFMTADKNANELKYLMDYYSSPRYEMGYVRAHDRNKALTDKAGKIMGGMKANGIYVHEEMRKVENQTFSSVQRSPYEVMMTAFSHAACMLSSCSVPVTYERNASIAAAFGDSGRTLDLNGLSGVIADFEAACALKKRGVDIGIRKWKGAPVPFSEYFGKEDEFVLLDGCIRPYADKDEEVFFDCELDEKAVVISEFDYDGKRVPASYLYENEKGQKFLVFTFIGSAVKYTSALASGYLRQKYFHEAAEWMNEKLPIKALGHPKLYIISKEDEKRRAYAIGNFSLDVIEEAKIKIPHDVQNAEFNGFSGRIENGEIVIDCLHPWQFGFIIAEKT